MKVIKLIAIGGAIYFGGRYLYSLNRAKEKVVIVVSGAKDKITLQGVSILIKYNIKNPTSASMRMTPPLIRLSLEGKQIATSNMQLVDVPEKYRDSSGKILIKAFEETGEIITRLMIPWLSLLSITPDVVKRLKSTDPKDKIELKVETTSQIFTLVGQFPYEVNSSIKL